MAYEVLSNLPPGSVSSRTRLARDGGVRVVLRQLDEAGAEPFLVGPSSATVLPLIDVVTVGEERCAVYDFVPGATLREIIEALRAKGRGVQLDLLGRVLIDAARAVGAIHTAVSPRAHTGLSDAALLIGFDGETRILDFGAPRSPGRFAAPDGGIPGDVFTLGATLHWALTGFTGNYAEDVKAGAGVLPVPSVANSDVTPALDDIVMTALSAQPGQRQGTAMQLADELEAVLAEAVMPAKGLGTYVQALLGDRLVTLQRLASARAPVPGAALELLPATGENPALTRKTAPGAPPSRALTDRRGSSTDPVVEAAAIPSGTVPHAGPPGAGESSDTSETSRVPAVPPEAVLPPPLPPAANPFSGFRGAPTQPFGQSAPSLARVHLEPMPESTDRASRSVATQPLAASAPVPPPSSLEAAAAALDDAERTGPVAPRAPTRPDAADAPSDELAEPASFSELPEIAATSASEGTDPRVPRPIALAQAEGTSPAFRPPAGDSGLVPLDPDLVENTTEEERRRARGQERIPTPPLGSIAASEELDVSREPTAIRPRPQPPAERTDPRAVAPAPRAGRRIIAGLLLLIAGGLGYAAWTGKLRRPPQGGVPVVVDDALDAGEEETALVEVDAGEAVEDGGTEEAAVTPEALADAGALGDAGSEAPDAGLSDSADAGVDAGTTPKKPAKPSKRPPRKKRRR